MAREKKAPFVAPPMPEPGPAATRGQQWGGALALVLSLVILAVLAPGVGDELSGRHLEAGDTLDVQGSIELTVADGWSLSGSSDELFTVLENGDATLTPLAAVSAADSGSAEETLQRDLDVLEADTTTGWQISAPISGITDEGYDYGFFTALGPDQSQAIWVISDGEGVVTVALLAPADTFATYLDSADAMAMSVRILEVL